MWASVCVWCLERVIWRLAETSSERMCWKTKSCYGNSQGWRRRVCLCCAWKWRDGHWQAEWRRSERRVLWSFAIPAAHQVPASSSSSCPLSSLVVIVLRQVGGRTNAESQWDSWKENSFSRFVSLRLCLFSLIYKQHHSLWSGYYTVHQHAFNGVEVLCG